MKGHRESLPVLEDEDSSVLDYVTALEPMPWLWTRPQHHLTVVAEVSGVRGGPSVPQPRGVPMIDPSWGSGGVELR